jgi:hypothetical protein
MLNANDLLLGLQIAVAVMLIVVLYHALFVVVDVRKIVRRVEDITAQVEDVLMKPLSMADQVLEIVLQFIEKQHAEIDKVGKRGKKKSSK